MEPRKSLFSVRHVGECSDWNRGLFPRAPLQEDTCHAGDLYSVLHPGSSHDHAGTPNIYLLTQESKIYGTP